jgi:hypothetical protein
MNDLDPGGRTVAPSQKPDRRRWATAVAPALRRAGGRVRPSLARFVALHGVVTLAILVGLVANAAVMTDGTFELGAREKHFTEFFDELGSSILHGRFDVPRATIEHEALIIDGKVYGYFGPTPALVRIPLDFLFPWMRGRWARWLILACCAASLVAFYSLYRQVGRLLGRPQDGLPAQYAAAALLLAVAVGSTLFFVSRRSVLYHESIAFGTALALVSYALLHRYLTGAGIWTLLGVGASALLAFLARPSVGAGPMFAVSVLACGMLLAWLSRLAGRVRGRAPGERRIVRRLLAVFRVPQYPQLGRHLLALSLLLAAGLGFTVFRNVRTFGNVVGTPSLKNHVTVSSNPSRLARTGGRYVQPSNLMTSARAYFRFGSLVIKPKAPWFSLYERAPQYPEAHVDYQEPLVSMPSGYPFWTVVTLLGIAATLWPFRRVPLATMRLILLSSAIAFVPTLITSAMSLRYLHDLFPLVAVGSAIGTQQLLVLQTRVRFVRYVMPLLVVLALYTCLVNVVITLQHDRW